MQVKPAFLGFRLSGVACAVLVLLLGFGLLHAAASARGGAPNLLIVLVDQMRAHALGFMKEDPVLTPHLDSFAGQSLVLTHAVSNYPLCSPYRAMLMTGMYPHSNGVLGNCNSNGARYGYQLRATDRCWSDVLKARGYSLGYIGKWHLDSPYRPYVRSYNNRERFAWNEWCPPERRHGFDFWCAYGTFDRHLEPEYWAGAMERWQRLKVYRWGPAHETDLAIEYLRNRGGRYRAKGRPFALVVSMNPPHTPYSAVPQRYVERYTGKTYRDLINRANVDLTAETPAVREAKREIKHYFAMVTGVDEQFGRLLAELDRLGLRDDTIVLFTSDHGNCIGSHNHRTKNVPYEESMRIPFLIRWPGHIKPRRDDLLISTPDIAPTLLDLMGLSRDVPSSWQGVSYAELCRTGRGPRPTSQLYLRVPYGRPALGARGVRTHRYTLVIEKTPSGRKRTVLYDNVKDPYQLRNVAPQRPEIVRELLRAELKPKLKHTGDPFLTKGL